MYLSRFFSQSLAVTVKQTFQVEPYAAFLHDAVMLYALALNRTLSKSAAGMQHERLIADGKGIVRNMYNISFQGENENYGVMYILRDYFSKDLIALID